MVSASEATMEVIETTTGDSLDEPTSPPPADLAIKEEPQVEGHSHSHTTATSAALEPDDDATRSDDSENVATDQANEASAPKDARALNAYAGNVVDQLRKNGWKYQKIDHHKYFFAPGATMETGTKGVDYFDSFVGVMDHCRSSQKWKSNDDLMNAFHKYELNCSEEVEYQRSAIEGGPAEVKDQVEEVQAPTTPRRSKRAKHKSSAKKRSKRSLAKNAIEYTDETKKRVWRILENLGWSLNKKGNHTHYFPPGITKKSGKVREAYFDEWYQVFKYLEDSGLRKSNSDLAETIARDENNPDKELADDNNDLMADQPPKEEEEVNPGSTAERGASKVLDLDTVQAPAPAAEEPINQSENLDNENDIDGINEDGIVDSNPSVSMNDDNPIQESQEPDHEVHDPPGQEPLVQDASMYDMAAPTQYEATPDDQDNDALGEGDGDGGVGVIAGNGASAVEAANAKMPATPMNPVTAAAAASAAAARVGSGVMDASMYLSADEISHVTFLSRAFKGTIWKTLQELGWTRTVKSANPRFEAPPLANGTPGKGLYGTKNMIKFVQHNEYWRTHPAVLSSITAYRTEYASEQAAKASDTAIASAAAAAASAAVGGVDGAGGMGTNETTAATAAAAAYLTPPTPNGVAAAIPQHANVPHDYRYLTAEEIDMVSFKSSAFKDSIWATLQRLGWRLEVRIGVYTYINPHPERPGERKSVNKTKKLVQYIQTKQHWVEHPEVITAIKLYRELDAAKRKKKRAPLPYEGYMAPPPAKRPDLGPTEQQQQPPPVASGDPYSQAAGAFFAASAAAANENQTHAAPQHGQLAAPADSAEMSYSDAVPPPEQSQVDAPVIEDHQNEDTADITVEVHEPNEENAESDFDEEKHVVAEAEVVDADASQSPNDANNDSDVVMI